MAWQGCYRRVGQIMRTGDDVERPTRWRVGTRHLAVQLIRNWIITQHSRDDLTRKVWLARLDAGQKVKVPAPESIGGYFEFFVEPVLEPKTPKQEQKGT